MKKIRGRTCDTVCASLEFSATRVRAISLNLPRCTKVNLTASDVNKKRTIYSFDASFAILSVSARSTEIDKMVHSLIISLPLFRSLIHVRPILCLISQHLSDALAEVRRRN